MYVKKINKTDIVFITNYAETTLIKEELEKGIAIYPAPKKYYEPLKSALDKNKGLVAKIVSITEIDERITPIIRVNNYANIINFKEDNKIKENNENIIFDSKDVILVERRKKEDA